MMRSSWSVKQNHAGLFGLLYIRHLDKARRSPRASATADALNEVFDHCEALLRVVYLRVELYAPGLLTLDAVCCYGNILGRGNDRVALGNGGDGVAVRHPYLRLGAQRCHKWVVGTLHLHTRTAILAAGRCLNLATEEVGEVLRTIAYAEQR